jgi:hypothetical protein
MRRPERVATSHTFPAEKTTEAAGLARHRAGRRRLKPRCAGERRRHGNRQAFATDPCKQKLFPSSRFDCAQLFSLIIETSPERKKPVMAAA